MVSFPKIVQRSTPFFQRGARLLYIFKRLLLVRHICVPEAVDLLDLLDEFFRCDWRETFLDRIENPAKRLARRLCVIQ